MPLPPGPGPHRDQRTVGPLRVHLHAHQGNRRHRIEDAWAIVEGARLGAQQVDAFAVFDGLGGVPNGQEAAWSAADALRDVLLRAHAPEEILGLLNDVVLPTGGSTTATILLVARQDASTRNAWLLSIGDSSAYAALDGRPFERLNPQDRIDRHVLSDWLGRPHPGGHLRTLELHPGDTAVLCTDGADEVAGARALEPVVDAGADATPAALDHLFDGILEAGAPDNATVLVVRCLVDGG